MFGFFKKNKGGSLFESIKIGSSVIYKSDEWTVKDVYTYVWDNGVKDHEFELKKMGKTLYLGFSGSYEEWSMYESAENDKIPFDFSRLALAKRELPKNFDFGIDKFKLVDQGLAMVTNSEESFSMENWWYKASSSNNYFSFNKYEDSTVEIYKGKTINETDFKVK